MSLYFRSFVWEGRYRSNTERVCTVSIQHGRSGTNRLYTKRTEHGVDWTRHQWGQLGTREPYNASIVHDWLGTIQLHTGTTVHHILLYVVCTVNKTSVNGAPTRLCTSDLARSRPAQIKMSTRSTDMSTSTTLHRNNWALIGYAQRNRCRLDCVRICYAQSSGHQLDCLLLQLCTAGDTANILPILPVVLSDFFGRVLYAHLNDGAAC